MLHHKGYTGVVEFDDEANIFHGEVLHVNDVITFQGTSVEELRNAFVESVEDYLAFCAERGEEPEKPFSGQFLLRVSPELHRKISLGAHIRQTSLNAFVTQAVQEKLLQMQI
ncbi:MAG: type II toxin-antitoxin system HicB family antitoxin [Candidatus Kapabacteria bacterium]|jgi:predicted HicB family RNase H-like nuclease|nr:type II toxin-antitoxin system HicB family antitoxin [Candidatus Kapabacteria bacterium]